MMMMMMLRFILCLIILRSHGSILRIADDLPNDNFAGNDSVNVYCLRLEGFSSDRIWLEEPSGSRLSVKGKFNYDVCTYGDVNSFRVSKNDYIDVLKKCQAAGYDAAHPSIPNRPGFRPFKVGDYLTEHFSWIDATEILRFPAMQIPQCGGAQVTIPADIFVGGQKTYYACAKTGDAEFPYAEVNKTKVYDLVQGQWIRHWCGYGFSSSFRISSQDYNSLLKKCKDKGYETVQPAADTTAKWTQLYAFQIGAYYAESYTSSVKYQAMPIPLCGSGGGADQPFPPPNCNGEDNTNGRNEPLYTLSETIHVYCVKDQPGAHAAWTWLMENGNVNYEVKGKWEQDSCASVSVRSFRVTKASYNDMVKRCKAKGYETVQPATNGTDWYPFKYGDFIEEYYARISDKTMRYPRMRVPSCRPAASLPDDGFIGGQKAYVTCANSTKNIQLRQSKLKKYFEEIQGQWIKNQCGSNTVESYRIPTAEYIRVLNECRAEGYETAQASKYRQEGWYPFQIGNVYADQYIGKMRYQAMAVPSCVAACPDLAASESDVLNTTGEESFFYCAKQLSGKELDFVVYIEQDFILTDNYTKVKGKWETEDCPDGTLLKSFHVSTETYNQILQKCIASGYETAQPVGSDVENTWNPFKVSQELKAYYYTANDKVVKYETSQVSACVGNRLGNVAGQDSFFYCAKQLSNKKLDFVVYIDKDLVLTNQYSTVKGYWETDDCPDGMPLKSFHVPTLTYNQMLQKCNGSGYEIPQPVSPNVENFWYPFKVGKELKTYYYESDDGVIKYETSQVGSCMGKRPGSTLEINIEV